MMASSFLRINDLPDEVLCEIFSKLTPKDVMKYAINVCRKWNTIVQENKMFWKYVQLTINCDYFIGECFLDKDSAMCCQACAEDSYPDELLVGEKDLEMVSSVRYLKFIEGSQSKTLPALLLMKIVDIISKTCSSIEKVEFLRCFGATSNDFIHFLRERYKYISDVRFGFNAMYFIPYAEISKFQNLTTLVSLDYGLKRSDLELLADGCPTLSNLWILVSRSPKVDDILYFLDQKKNILKELGLGMTLQDCIVEKLKDCHCLEVFFATDARFVTDVCIKSFCNLPKLKYCSLQRATFELDTVREMAKTTSSVISTKLLVLDLSDYVHYKDYKKLILQSEDLYIKILKVGIFLLFCLFKISDAQTHESTLKLRSCLDYLLTISCFNEDQGFPNFVPKAS
jgi:hypothetical protein